jgi:hypothetical protein
VTRTLLPHSPGSVALKLAPLRKARGTSLRTDYQIIFCAWMVEAISTINGRARRTKPHAGACPNTTPKASDSRSELSERHVSANSGID